MGSLCQCISRICCDEQQQQQHEDGESHGGGTVEAAGLMNRGTETNDQANNNNSNNHTCCAHTQGIHDLLRRLRDRWQPTNMMSTIDQPYARMPLHDDEDDEFTLLKNKQHHGAKQALSFSSCEKIPCIASNTIVLPGSKLQQEMAQTMCTAKLTAEDVECVICMERFEDSNPRMPTLCGCGENKTYFHLPCLYQWLDQSTECPSCRETLSWEEF